MGPSMKWEFCWTSPFCGVMKFFHSVVRNPRVTTADHPLERVSPKVKL